jgi:integrase
VGRPRKNPQDVRLPKYVYLKKGRYVHVAPLGGGKLGLETVLAPAAAPLRQVWEAYEALRGDVGRGTLHWLCAKYLESPAFTAKHPATKAEYQRCHRQVLAAKLANGAGFGDVAVHSITPGTIVKYRDKRGEKARVRANREIAYLSVVFSWAYERDMVKLNPIKGVKRLPEPPRSRYVEDWEYDVVYRKALTKVKATYLAPAMELAYLMRLRQVEVRALQKSDSALQKSDCTPEGVRARRRKGSREQIVEWSDRLQAAIAAADTPAPIGSIYVLHDRHGQPITQSALTLPGAPS